MKSTRRNIAKPRWDQGLRDRERPPAVVGAGSRVVKVSTKRAVNSPLHSPPGKRERGAETERERRSDGPERARDSASVPEWAVSAHHRHDCTAKQHAGRPDRKSTRLNSSHGSP